ncbi:hypothetical protein D3C76_1240710 [compost metagenome]
MSNTGHGYPVNVSLHRTKLLEGWGVECRSLVLSITFRVRQIEGDADACLRLSMLDLESCKLVSAKPSPESDQH